MREAPSYQEQPRQPGEFTPLPDDLSSKGERDASAERKEMEQMLQDISLITATLNSRAEATLRVAVSRPENAEALSQAVDDLELVHLLTRGLLDEAGRRGRVEDIELDVPMTHYAAGIDIIADLKQSGAVRRRFDNDERVYQGATIIEQSVIPGMVIRTEFDKDARPVRLSIVGKGVLPNEMR